ncbi:WGR domain-containing protein, predicted DNA-binding domain in MolR [Rhizobium sp. RU20A]|uniref:WGR domain-containing protein n=1 Tax=Rhizobium sp. RU20A TaxID=1907412 RepID=UPI000954B0A3|nr:WGR domain-containing protein [Rhizobium sp. RU20A]SIR29959.1 WGR domain-containing protein, predicted DNA-binding domain in MolR [Rhizobium sp. RU20A]
MTTPHSLHFRREDPARNMARYYGLSLQPTLFGPVALVRCWGRIGTRGQECTEWHGSKGEAEAALARHAARRLKRGYRRLEGA